MQRIKWDALKSERKREDEAAEEEMKQRADTKEEE